MTFPFTDCPHYQNIIPEQIKIQSLNKHNFITHIKENFHLAYPVMISQLGHIMMGVTDSIMVGHVSAESLAAASLANVAFNVLLLFGIGVSYAITPLVAEANGKHDDEKIIHVLRHGLVINFALSLILLGIVTISKNLLYKIDQPQEVIHLTIPYLDILVYSLIPTLIFQSFKQFAEGISLTRIAMVVVIATNVVHIIFNYIFIYGHAGFPAMGLTGAGYATLLSRVFMAVFMIMYIFYGKNFKKYSAIFSFGNYSKKLFIKMLQIGVPAGSQFIFEVAAFDFSAVMMGWLGSQTLAAHQIAINLASISYMITSGLGAAATIRVGYFLGKKDWLNLKTASYTLILMGLGIMTLWAFLFILGRNFLPALYVDNTNVITIAAPLLIIAGIFQLADGTQVVCTGALRGMQDVKIPSLLIFIAYWIIGLPLGYWLGNTLHYGATGIWLGLLIGLMVTAIALFLRLKIILNRTLKRMQNEIDSVQ